MAQTIWKRASLFIRATRDSVFKWLNCYHNNYAEIPNISSMCCFSLSSRTPETPLVVLGRQHHQGSKNWLSSPFLWPSNRDSMDRNLWAVWLYPCSSSPVNQVPSRAPGQVLADFAFGGCRSSTLTHRLCALNSPQVLPEALSCPLHSAGPPASLHPLRASWHRGRKQTGWNLSHHLRLTDTWSLTFSRIFAFWEYLGNLSQLSPSSLSIGQTLFLSSRTVNSSRLPHSCPARLPTCCPREKAQETAPKGGPPHLWLSRGKGSGGDGRETWERGDALRIKIKD